MIDEKMKSQNKKKLISSKSQLKSAILSYFQEHPGAGDTLEGIAYWWLARRRIDEVVDEVAKILEELMEKGLIEAQRTPGGTTVYKLKSRGDDSNG